MLLFIITIIVLTVIIGGFSLRWLRSCAVSVFSDWKVKIIVLVIYINIYVYVYGGIFELKDAYYFVHGTLNIASM